MKISFFILFVGLNGQLTVNTRFNGELRLALNKFLVSLISCMGYSVAGDIAMLATKSWEKFEILVTQWRHLRLDTNMIPTSVTNIVVAILQSTNFLSSYCITPVNWHQLTPIDTSPRLMSQEWHFLN